MVRILRAYAFATIETLRLSYCIKFVFGTQATFFAVVSFYCHNL